MGSEIIKSEFEFKISGVGASVGDVDAGVRVVGR